jgi:hypothetical protein
MAKKIMFTLALLHLLLIAVVVFHGLDNRIAKGVLEKPLSFLCSINYSVWQYGFFSPDVGKSTEIEIVLHDNEERKTKLSTLDGFKFYTHNQESANRFYGFKVHTARDSTFQDLCARSAATRLLNIHTNAWVVDYTMRSIRYPSLSDFNKNKPVVKREFYSTTFALK